MATTIKLDRERTLKCDYNALSAFDEATGMSPYDGKTWEPPRPSVYRAMLWAMLQSDDDSLTLKDVGAMITGDNQAKVFEAVAAEMIAFVGDSKKKETDSNKTSGAYGRGRKSSTASRTKSSGS